MSIWYHLTRKNTSYKVKFMTRMRKIWYRNDDYETCDYCGRPIIDAMFHKVKAKALRPNLRPGQYYCKAIACQKIKAIVNKKLYGGRHG